MRRTESRLAGSRGEANTSDPGRLTVLFDRDCGFCRWTVRQLRLLDRAHRLEFIPLQEAAHRPERSDLAALAASRRLEVDLHVVLTDGRIEAGGRAVLEILFVLPGGYLFRPWALIPGLAHALDAGYRWVAGHRPLLARLLRID